MPRRTRTKTSDRALRCAAFFALVLGVRTEIQAETSDSKSNEAVWTLGVARFSVSGDTGASTTIGDILPRLVLDRLAALPPRRASPEETREAGNLARLRELFTAGADLAAKLDARAVGFFDPSIDREARKPALDKADSAVRESRKKLESLQSSPEMQADPARRTCALWAGHAKGELIELKSGVAAAAASNKLNFLVSGALEIRSGYAFATLRGYDADLGREVFTWEGVCSVEDPEPLADEIAAKLERWTAGGDYARYEFRVAPSFARVKVNGRVLGQERVAYIFDADEIVVELEAAGYEPKKLTSPVVPGERRRFDIELSPLAVGTVLVTADPPEASISLDSVPLGAPPQTITLDGQRLILSASAPGRESASVILPESGESKLDLVLPPADDLGPNGRIEAARGGFYSALGWLAVSIPVTALSLGVRNVYAEAETRSLLESTSQARMASDIAVVTASIGTAAAAVNMIIHLIKYLRVSR